MHHTHYHRPTSVAEAVKLIGEHPDDKVLAGGQSTLPSMKLGLLAPEGFIDLSGIGELRGIRAEGTSVRIGAMTTHHTVATSKDVQAMIPALAALAGGIGDRAVRNCGTIGGSLSTRRTRWMPPPLSTGSLQMPVSRAINTSSNRGPR